MFSLLIKFQGPTPVPLSDPDHLPKAPPSQYVAVGVELQYVNPRLLHCSCILAMAKVSQTQFWWQVPPQAVIPLSCPLPCSSNPTSLGSACETH